MGVRVSLQSIVADSLQISMLLGETGGELTPEIEAMLTCNTKDLAIKLDSYVAIMDQFEAQCELWKAKAAQIAKVAKSFDTARERLKSNVKLAMDMMGTTEVKGDLFRFKLSNVKPSLIIDEKLIPNEFKNAVTSFVIDKERIKEAIAAGTQVQGATVVHSMSLRNYPNTGK